MLNYLNSSCNFLIGRAEEIIIDSRNTEEKN